LQKKIQTLHRFDVSHSRRLPTKEEQQERNRTMTDTPFSQLASYVIKTEEHGQYLVMTYSDGTVSLAYREESWDTWSPPVYGVQVPHE